MTNLSSKATAQGLLCVDGAHHELDTGSQKILVNRYKLREFHALAVELGADGQLVNLVAFRPQLALFFAHMIETVEWKSAQFVPECWQQPKQWVRLSDWVIEEADAV